MISDDRLKRMRRVAEEALGDGAQWFYGAGDDRDDGLGFSPHVYKRHGGILMSGEHRVNDDPNVMHAAECDPASVLAVLDEIDRLRAIVAPRDPTLLINILDEEESC